MRINIVVIFLLMTFCFSGKVMASHIVGGEFELIHLEEYRYTLNLNLYFDDKHGHSGAHQDFITVAIFRKSNNQYIRSVTIPLLSETRVEYFQPECSSGEVITDKLVYSTEIELAPGDYKDAEGYYIAWERCCRNYGINNIFSQDTQANPNAIFAGQTFYLEFPPVVKDQEPFINSSPILFPPLNDYACPNRPYWVDFQGTDPDGDSLVYSIVTPLNTFSGSPTVVNGANPGPYPEIIWRPGFSIDNIMNGAPDLQITNSGFLTVTPTTDSLFVFAVKVEEYRDNIKIGEVRRDFQLFVVKSCPEATAPKITGRKLGDTSYSYDENMNITFPYGVSDADRCIEVQVSDADASKLEDNFTEKVYIQAIPLGFKGEIEDILPENISATLTNNGTANFQICFDECPIIQDGFFDIGIVAFDDACALPLTDTLRISVFVEPPPNDDPYFVDGNSININVQEQAGGVVQRKVIALDNDQDDLTLSIQPLEDFDPEAYGISFLNSSFPGEVETQLTWNYDCQQYSFDGRTSFPILLIVEDVDECLLSNIDSLFVTLNIELPPNSEPDIFIDQDISRNDEYFNIVSKINSSLSFEVKAVDQDNDIITLTAIGANLNLNNEDINFSPIDGPGVPGIESTFRWDIPCDYDLENDSLRLFFLTEDFDKCQITNSDTVAVDIKLFPPDTHKPILSIIPTGNTDLINHTVEITIGESISLQLDGMDQDFDSLTLILLNNQELLGADFPISRGRGEVNSDFIWTPGCNILQGRDSIIHSGYFTLNDDNCFEAKEDSLEVNFIIHDIENYADRFNPPNVITPNNDSFNDYFTLNYIIDGSTGENRSMPEDNCAGQFEYVQIINRWGRKVFESRNRDFIWSPVNIPTGVYYYSLKYTDKDYKGVISVLY